MILCIHRRHCRSISSHPITSHPWTTCRRWRRFGSDQLGLAHAGFGTFLPCTFHAPLPPPPPFPSPTHRKSMFVAMSSPARTTPYLNMLTAPPLAHSFRKSTLASDHFSHALTDIACQPGQSVFSDANCSGDMPRGPGQAQKYGNQWSFIQTVGSRQAMSVSTRRGIGRSMFAPWCCHCLSVRWYCITLLDASPGCPPAHPTSLSSRFIPRLESSSANPPTRWSRYLQAYKYARRGT